MTFRPRTRTTPNSFLHLPPPSPDGRFPTIVYFITGNPGLISYYHEFLNLLSRSPYPVHTPNDTDEAAAEGSIPSKCIIAGFSLGGFELLDPTSPVEKTTDISSNNQSSEPQIDLHTLEYPPNFIRPDIYSLRQQISLCNERLYALVRLVLNLYKSANARHEANVVPRSSKVKIILIGHSVGAFIALELVRQHHNDLNIQAEVADDHNPTSHVCDTDTAQAFSITDTILLTPTILNIAHSPSGRFAAPLLTRLPYFPALVQLANDGLGGLLTDVRLEWMVSRVTGMKKGSAALNATVAFLRCPGAVKQALHMAGDEMSEICGNTWGEEVWGVVDGDGEGQTREGNGGWMAPRLHFWFAREDHWVADVTRDEIMSIVDEKYGAEGKKDVACGGNDRPEVVIDVDEGLVHAWCLTQSELVATRVRIWIERALKGGR